jgi:hypothetical protein
VEKRLYSLPFVPEAVVSVFLRFGFCIGDFFIILRFVIVSLRVVSCGTVSLLPVCAWLVRASAEANASKAMVFFIGYLIWKSIVFSACRFYGKSGRS